MTIVFKYKAIKRPNGTTVKTPSIPILLKWNEQFETIALLDSGADVSAMPISVAEILGCNLSGKTEPAFGIGGRVDSIQSKVNLLVGKGHEHYEFEIPIKVILGQYDFPILLGRQGFFNKFIISFDEQHEKVSLKKISERYS